MNSIQKGESEPTLKQ